MDTKTWIEGDPEDLKLLATAFATGDAQVREEHGSYYLCSPTLDIFSSADLPTDEAEELLRLMNGIARSHDPFFNPARLSGSTSRRGRTIVFKSVEVKWQVKAHGSKNPPQDAPAHFLLSRENSDVADAVKLMSAPRPNWVDLYKIHEIVRESINPAKISQLGWLTPREESAFTGSANHPLASGADARHARLSGARPKRIISIDEGQSLMARLVISWMDWLLERDGIPE
ncbi:hypothetical protein [Micromonospora sp. RTGN7]|uniref:hypothetical protein n=1 Tax=Micromonospora sp. RTGN7 TaxID=3016526 RepID=UPI0029FEFE16|nr:hypothetical protein [Micromonospora sp. RTGN7]